MKEVFLAYFDFLGFKEFILNNDDDRLSYRMSNICRDIELALSNGKTRSATRGGLVADISQHRVNCLNISDTVLFWTNGTELDSLKDLIEVAFDFNWRNNLFGFPVRGAIIKGKIKPISDFEESELGATYSISSIYGKGLVEAHLKAEAQDWAGTVIDTDLVNEFNSVSDAKEFFQLFAKKYKVPYKKGSNIPEEYVLKLGEGSLNDEGLSPWIENIKSRFEADNKGIMGDSVRVKLQNTIDFL